MGNKAEKKSVQNRKSPRLTAKERKTDLLRSINRLETTRKT